MDLIAITVVAVTLMLATAILVWSRQRRAAFRAAIDQRGWHLSRDGKATIIVPAIGDWTVTMTRSQAVQKSPPTSQIVTTVWNSPTPAAQAAALIAGPAPRPELRDLAAELLGSATAAMTRWLGIDQVSGGRPLRAVPATDQRLMVFATEEYGSTGALTEVADAISAWCEVYGTEREQPVVSINDSGIAVRVRANVLRPVEQLDAFVDLSIRCRAGIDRSRR